MKQGRSRKIVLDKSSATGFVFFVDFLSFEQRNACSVKASNQWRSRKLYGETTSGHMLNIFSFNRFFCETFMTCIVNIIVCRPLFIHNWTVNQSIWMSLLSCLEIYVWFVSSVTLTDCTVCLRNALNQDISSCKWFVKGMIQLIQSIGRILFSCSSIPMLEYR